MTNLSPVLISGVVVLVLATIGAVLYFMREVRTYSGYRDIAADVKKLAATLEGVVFRDGNDLVVTGDYHNFPTLLRFSNEENTPGMSLEVRIPNGYYFSLAARQTDHNHPGTKVKLTGVLDKHFEGRSRNAAEIELLLSQRGAQGIFERLCCSRKTMLEMNPGKIQAVEMVVPSMVERHVSNHLTDIRDLASIIEKMPGSELIKVKAIPRERSSWTFRATVAAGVAIAAFSVLAATRDHSKPAVVQAADAETINGIVKADAALIPMAEEWRVANSTDFDTAFTAVLNGSGLKPDSRLEFDSDGDGRANAVAYLLIAENGARRVVLLIDHRVAFDSSFANVAGIVRIPAVSLSRVHWNQSQKSDSPVAGDGILMVRKADDPHSAVLLYFQKGSLQTGAPVDYRTIEFQ